MTVNCTELNGKIVVLSQSVVRSPHPKPRPLASVSSLPEEGLLRLLPYYTSMMETLEMK